MPISSDSTSTESAVQVLRSEGSLSMFLLQAQDPGLWGLRSQEAESGGEDTAPLSCPHSTAIPTVPCGSQAYLGLIRGKYLFLYWKQANKWDFIKMR